MAKLTEEEERDVDRFVKIEKWARKRFQRIAHAEGVSMTRKKAAYAWHQRIEEAAFRKYIKPHTED